MDPQRADMPVNSGPNDTTVFSRIHNNAYSTDFAVSHPPQSPISATGYGPAYPGFAGSPTADMPSHSNNAHTNNLRLFALLKRSLADESLQRYTEAAEKLAAWMSKEQAFYDEAKPYIINFLEVAQTTLRKVCGINPSLHHPFHISQCSQQVAHIMEAYVNLVRVVRHYEQKFVEPDYRSRLAAIFRTVDPIPGRLPHAPISPSSYARPTPTATQYAPPLIVRSPPTAAAAPQYTFFPPPGRSSNNNSPVIPMHVAAPGHMGAPSGPPGRIPPTVPSVPTTPVSAGPMAMRPPSRPSSVSQPNVTSSSPLPASAPPHGSPLVGSAASSTPSPSLSSISAGQPTTSNPKPKPKTKKKLSMFAGALDYLNSDLEWFAKNKGKSTDVKKEGEGEKGTESPAKAEPVAEGQVPQEQLNDPREAGRTDTDAVMGTREDEITLIASGEKEREQEQGRPPEVEAPALTQLGESTNEHDPIQEVDHGAPGGKNEAEGDNSAAEGVRSIASDDTHGHAEEVQMDPPTEDGNESDNVERILAEPSEDEALLVETTTTETLAVKEDKASATLSGSETVVRDVREETGHDGLQPMDVDAVEPEASHSIEQAMQVDVISVQQKMSDESPAPPKRKKRRRGPPGIPASQFIGAHDLHSHSRSHSTTTRSRESSPETTLASATAPSSSPSRIVRQREEQRSLDESSSESDAPLSSLVARRSASSSKPKRTPPRVPRGFKRHNANTASPPLDSGNEDVVMQEADPLATQPAPSTSRSAVIDREESSPDGLIPPNTLSTLEEGEISSNVVKELPAQEGAQAPAATMVPPPEDADTRRPTLQSGGDAVNAVGVGTVGSTQTSPQPAPPVLRKTFFDESMTVLSFARGASRGCPIDLSFSLDEERINLLKRWLQRYDTDDDATEQRCLSLACHPYDECSSNLPADSIDAFRVFDKEPIPWPLRSHPRLTFKDGSDNGVVLPVTPLSIDCDNLLDVSLRAHEGHNTFEITSAYGDTKDYVFVLHLHPPTSHQRDEVQQRKAQDSSWKQLLKSLTVIQMPALETFMRDSKVI